MGKPLMLQEADDARIESLKKRLRARTKIEVVRSALGRLERAAERAARARAARRGAPFGDTAGCGASTDAERPAALAPPRGGTRPTRGDEAGQAAPLPRDPADRV